MLQKHVEVMVATLNIELEGKLPVPSCSLIPFLFVKYIRDYIRGLWYIDVTIAPIQPCTALPKQLSQMLTNL